MTDGKDVLYVSMWVGALICTMIAWMYWDYVSAILYTFATFLLMLMMDALFYRGSLGKVKNDG